MLKFKKKKNSVQRLTEAQKVNRKRNSKKHYERFLSGIKYEYMIALDEAYFFLDYYNGKRKIAYFQAGKNIPKDRLIKCPESLPNGFVVVMKSQAEAYYL